MCPSRKRTTSIMNHGGFGELIVKVKGIDVAVPNSFVFSNGMLKKKAIKLINKLEAGKIGVQEFYATAE